MSVEPRTLKTEAEQTLADQYRAHRSALPGSAAVAARRDELFAVFERAGLPHRRIETWKYTDLRALMPRAAPLATPPGDDAVAEALRSSDAFPGLDRFRLVLVDGAFQAARSDRKGLADEGVQVATLADFLTIDHPNVLDILDTPSGAGDDATIALNGAMATDGVVIVIPDGRSLSKPIEIVHLTTGATPVAWFTRSAVKVGKDSSATILVTRVGPDNCAYQASSVVGLAAAEGSRVTVVDLQAQGNAAVDLGAFSARVAAAASIDHLAVAAGGRTTRLAGFITLEGEGARAGAFGANMLAGVTHGDIALVIDHTVPNANSRVLYKNVADGEASGAFEGRIVVRPDAQKTDGRMLINTLLLSDTSEFSAKPELEIYADDVQCGHGATIGQIDEQMLFYLQSRGIPRVEAAALLLRAFIAEGIEAVGNERLADAILPLVDAWLGQRT